MKRLTKSNNDIVIGGVCSGIAETYNLDPTIIRFIFVVLLLTPIVSNLIFLTYIIMVFLMPQN